MNKRDHKNFLKMIDRKFTNLGAERFVYREGYVGDSADVPELTGYRFQTKYGELVMHPDIPWHLDRNDKSRLRYDVTVFGRFTDAERVRSMTQSVSGKWNFHLGKRQGVELMDAIDYIVGKVEAILCKSELPKKS